MSEYKIRQLQRRIAIFPGDIEAQAALGIELRRSIDVIGLITGMSESIQKAIADRYAMSDAINQVAERLIEDIGVDQIAAQFSAADIAEEFDASRSGRCISQSL